MSMMGVLLTSLCTPVGFAHVFTVLGHVIVQPEVRVVIMSRVKLVIVDTLR